MDKLCVGFLIFSIIFYTTALHFWAGATTDSLLKLNKRLQILEEKKQ